jgi:hypothetical protein
VERFVTIFHPEWRELFLRNVGKRVPVYKSSTSKHSNSYILPPRYTFRSFHILFHPSPLCHCLLRQTLTEFHITSCCASSGPLSCNWSPARCSRPPELTLPQEALLCQVFPIQKSDVVQTRLIRRCSRKFRNIDMVEHKDGMPKQEAVEVVTGLVDRRHCSFKLQATV